ncbi:MAG TPA: DDE-type integrase/transposase/recombinase [Pyrinomonadaceae bacterium]|nr:DDE-type integrase/transposase/recombinase [Pyrinomonadaceae bacterium]
MKQRQAVTEVTVQRYRQGSKKVKQGILNEFCETTGYCRGYARFVLRNHGRQVWLRGKRVIVGDMRERQQRQKPRYYNDEVVRELIKLWELLNYSCGKRLVAIMPELIVRLEQFGELRLNPNVREKLLRLSAATVDRLLQPERRKQQLRRRSHTKPGTLLKHQIPIRTFAEWDEQQPGFAEIDLVAHDGGLALGDYCQTLDLTDVFTGWTETEAIPNKAQVWVFEAIQRIRERLPFPLRGLDSDNGSEFLNTELLRYCKQQRITFTRTRPYRKNDNCYVEQKNYSVVRQTVGYQRFDTPAELMLLQQLYATLRLYTNFFQPTMKLKSKERIGSRVKKSYHAPQTPYQRVLLSADITGADKKRLQRQYRQLNPAALKRELDQQRQELFRLAAKKRPPKPKRRLNQKTLQIKPHSWA